MNLKMTTNFLFSSFIFREVSKLKIFDLHTYNKMIVYAVYLMTKDGVELISEKFQSQVSIPDATLLSALFVAFQQMAESVTTLGIPKKICFDEMTYHLQSFGNFQVVIVTNTDKSPRDLLFTLGYQFMGYSSSLIRFDGNISRFEPYRDVLNRVIAGGATADLSQSLNPAAFLDAMTIMSLPQKVQKTARAVISYGSSSFEELVEELDCTELDLIENLEFLREKGYIGIKKVDGVNHYFTAAGLPK